MTDLTAIRERVRTTLRVEETWLVQELSARWGPDLQARAQIQQRAHGLVRHLREDSRPSLMEDFLAEYGLSTEEGVALMCLAEALLRVPDTETIDELIEDKIAPSAWGEHLGDSSSSLVNASTWALMLTGKVLDDGGPPGIARTLRSAIKRVGEPVIRIAVNRAMKELGRQFVLGQDMPEALARARKQEKRGYTYSYDMLGEAAMTAKDADAFYEDYLSAIEILKTHASHEDIRQNPGISIKLSALHPRYDAMQKQRVMDELVPRAAALAIAAKNAGIGLNIDAEEADRLDLSLDIIEALLRDPRLSGWDGFGVVVQAYSKRAPAVIDWLYALAGSLERKIMVRLVKGAYWDSEIKYAQAEGVPDFPVYTYKAATDISYICCARQLLSMSGRIYPQFATHNAHTAAAILEFAEPGQAFEFQRLHGMGESLHERLRTQEGTACRIYAPVGSHRELLAYLVRRLLENGANSSFVNQIIDQDLRVEDICADPFDHVSGMGTTSGAGVLKPGELFSPARKNSLGWNLRTPVDAQAFETARAPFRHAQWQAGPRLAVPVAEREEFDVINPADESDKVGTCIRLETDEIPVAAATATPWHVSAKERADTLRRAADLYEENHGEIFAILSREAGKSPTDAIAELREAVDFLRYYAGEAERHGDLPARGVIACISPWNFPLAIFTGQVAAALAAGNAVLAKPAEATPISAWFTTGLLHKAGVPLASLQLLPGEGRRVGSALTQSPYVSGTVFTGSTQTARHINQAMADSVSPHAPLIAETGGLNAMIVDSTALPEQAVRDILASAFQSAGQRCSALRMLYVQEDIAAPLKKMLFGAMDELAIGNPWLPATDVGPVISAEAKADINAYIEIAASEGRLIKQVDAPETGFFVKPSVISVKGIQEIEREIFGPVLHLATFRAAEIDTVLEAINASGYALTFGLHSRVDDRVEHITSLLNAGNLYVNRNQIGAIVESQPFGGQGLSGTGPKAGGPHYVPRFYKPHTQTYKPAEGRSVSLEEAQAFLDSLPVFERHIIETRDMPGPTGESNRLSILPRGTLLCLGPNAEAAEAQAKQAAAMHCRAICIAPDTDGPLAIDGHLDRTALSELKGFDGVVLWSSDEDLRETRRALSRRAGPILPLITQSDFHELCLIEQHLCIDTTAAGGNTTLMAEAS